MPTGLINPVVLEHLRVNTTMPESNSEHKGRVAVITGGSSGIGNAIADRLQLEGASVSIMDLMPRAVRT